MPVEYELRFREFDRDAVLTRLKTMGARQVHPQVMYKVTVFEHPLGKANTYIRVRDEAGKLQLTYKRNMDRKFVKEYDLNVDDYKTACKILKHLGCKKKYSYEKIREKWAVAGCKEVVFDVFPGCPEYMEVECDDEAKLEAMVASLGLSQEDYKHFEVPDLYAEYGITDDRPKGSLSFKNVADEIGPYVAPEHKGRWMALVKEQRALAKAVSERP